MMQVRKSNDSVACPATDHGTSRTWGSAANLEMASFGVFLSDKKPEAFPPPFFYGAPVTGYAQHDEGGIQDHEELMS
ncbi:hypothetical protein CDAR_592161 [Caerostris darwini]|uniref:Uncharacterized protein n=1 Tax=Caerostris darwini TaxID=1538125 RepID=A0AAV4W2I1_9ARAC|nr:hypothetical protein CDAR_592161 [Caerostris darwini]